MVVRIGEEAVRLGEEATDTLEEIGTGMDLRTMIERRLLSLGLQRSFWASCPRRQPLMVC